MTPTQRAAAERLIAEHPTLFMNDLPDWCDDAFHLLRELAAEPVQEPVAWVPYCIADCGGGVQGEYRWDEVDEKRFEVSDQKYWKAAPLYAAPQQRKPLSEFQRMKIIGDEFPLALVEPIVIQKIDSVCLAIERHHGVGEEA